MFSAASAMADRFRSFHGAMTVAVVAGYERRQTPWRQHRDIIAGFHPRLCVRSATRVKLLDLTRDKMLRFASQAAWRPVAYPATTATVMRSWKLRKRFRHRQSGGKHTTPSEWTRVVVHPFNACAAVRWRARIPGSVRISVPMTVEHPAVFSRSIILYTRGRFLARSTITAQVVEQQ